MNDLIVIEKSIIGNEEVNSVDARDLHSRLGLKKDFTSWMKDNIKKLNLVDGVDYLLTQKGEQLPSGMKYVSEYILTLDAGKHIAMMTNTITAHSVRTYFIEFEKRAKQMLAAHIIPSGVRPEIEAAEIFSKFNDVGKMIGFDANMAAFSANNATRKIININVLELMGVTKLIAPTQVADLNPGELGRFMNPIRNSVQVNEMLVQLGYQVRTGVSKCPYQATEKGLKFSRLNDVPRLHTEGTAQQLRWFPSILDEADVQWATGIITMKEAA